MCVESKRSIKGPVIVEASPVASTLVQRWGQAKLLNLECLSYKQLPAPECGGISLAVSTNPRAHCKQCSGQSQEKQPPAVLFPNFVAVHLITPYSRQPPVVPWRNSSLLVKCVGSLEFQVFEADRVVDQLPKIGVAWEKEMPQKKNQAKFCVWTFVFILEKAWCCQTQGREGLFPTRFRILLCISRVLLEHV